MGGGGTVKGNAPTTVRGMMFFAAASKLWLFGGLTGSKQTDSSVHGVILVPPVSVCTSSSESERERASARVSEKHE